MCAVYSLRVLDVRDPIKTVFNCPPAIIERCDKLGLVDASNKPGGPVFYAKKITAMIVFGVLLGLLARYVNGYTTFWCGTITAYALWVIVNWFDAIVLDCIWFCHDKHFVIPGHEWRHSYQRGCIDGEFHRRGTGQERYSAALL